MRISKEWHDRLHILIPYYRRVLKLSQNDVYRRHANNKWIIAPATVKKLENHEQVFIKDEKYQDLLFNLNKRLHISQEIDHYLITQSNQLYCVMEAERYEEAIRIIETTLLSLKSQRHHVYYKECVFFLGKLYLYLKDSVFMNEQEYSLLFPLVNIFPIKLKEILLDFLYIHASGASEKIIFDFFNTYSLCTSEYLPNRINYANQLYEQGKGLRAEHVLLDTEPIAKEKGSKMQLAYIYIILSSIALHTDIELCYSYLHTLEKMYIEEQKDNNLKGMILLNLANRYLMLRDYERCSSHIKAYMVLNPKRHYTSNIILLCHCNTMLNEKINKDLFTKDALNLEFNDQLDKLLFSYYTKSFKNNEGRMKYLLNKVYPSLSKFDKVYARIVNDEIAKLSSESGSYINYFRIHILQQNENKWK